MTKQRKLSGAQERSEWRSWWEREAASTEEIDDEEEQRLMRGHRQFYPTPRHKFSFQNQAVPPRLEMTLDVGCGTGATIGWMHTGARTVVGIDFSANVLKLARCRLGQKGKMNVLLAVADAIALPFAASSFDRLTCMGVLQFLNREDTIKVFKESFRVTRDGGLDIFTVRNSLSPYAITRALAIKLAPLFRRQKKPYLHYDSYRMYRSQLEKLGVDIISEYSFGLEPILAPPFLIKLIRTVEVAIARRTKFLRPFGVTYGFEVRL